MLTPAALADLIERARNPSRHGDDPDHCLVCYGSCGAWPGDRAGDEEELISELADALEHLTASSPDPTPSIPLD